MSLFAGGLASGDIWTSISYESPLKDLLEAGDYDLEQLLAEDELLQELRGLHPKLVAFLGTEAAVARLLHYVVDPKPIALGMGGRTGPTATTTVAEIHDDDEAAAGSGAAAAAAELATATTLVTPKDPSTWLQEKGKCDDPEMLYIRYPFLACEIICCEIDAIIDLVVDGYVPDKTDDAPSGDAADNGDGDAEEAPGRDRLLDLLFSLLVDTPVGALDDYRAGYLEKLLRVLFKKRPTAMAAYLREHRERLVPALLRHLYCHSVMQIAQRLLLPHRPTPRKGGTVDGDEPDGATAVVGGAVVAVSDGGAEEALVTPAVEDGDDDGLPDANPEIRCEWSSSEQALSILLDSVIGDSMNAEANGNDASAPPSAAEQEQQLDLSLNASEVLITIIQNSMLSSPQMLRLTSTPVLERLVWAATTCRPDPNVFTYHESLLTSAMCVLESLILQLGGYGAVGTMSLVDESMVASSEERKGDVEAESKGELEDNQSQQEVEENEHLISDLSNLIQLLPLLLDKLSELLTHPAVAYWKSPTQSNKEPQYMLGNSRLRIVRVLEALVLLGDPDVDQKLVQSDCLELCLDFFWEFQWCSMLHQSVANLLVHVFEGGNARVDMQEYFLIRCNILVRLMDSFQEMVHDSQPLASSPDIVTNMDSVTNDSADANHSDDENEDEGADNDSPLPISEDDVEAAIEQEADTKSAQVDDRNQLPAENVSQISTEAVQFDSRGGSSVGAIAPAQTFRFGYMGHVIIICQALVHACSQTEMDDDDQTRQSEDGTKSIRSTDRLASIRRSTSSVVSKNTCDSVSLSKGDEESTEKEVLFLAEMVKCHPLSYRWDEFVNTTLASDTAVQSTPLGGSMAAEALRRPGLADDGDIGFDGQPSLPSRRLGELDMDDTDLDIAANMIAAISMGHTHTPSSDDEDELSESGDSNRSYNSGETNHSSGYLFDDPLGKDTSGLGIELEKLTKLNSDSHSSLKAGKESGEDDSSSASSSKSSSEEEGNTDDGGDAPVMDLFAGNFTYDQSNFSSPASGVAGEFDFANFDDAFAAADSLDVDKDFGAFIEATPSPVEDNQLADIFQASDRSQLLALDDADETIGAFVSDSQYLSQSDSLHQAEGTSISIDVETASIEQAEDILPLNTRAASKESETEGNTVVKGIDRPDEVARTVYERSVETTEEDS